MVMEIVLCLAWLVVVSTLDKTRNMSTLLNSLTRGDINRGGPITAELLLDSTEAEEVEYKNQSPHMLGWQQSSDSKLDQVSLLNGVRQLMHNNHGGFHKIEERKLGSSLVLLLLHRSALVMEFSTVRNLFTNWLAMLSDVSPASSMLLHDIELVMDCSSVHKLDSSVDISPSPLVQGSSPSTSSHSSASGISMYLMG
jgi:hypothetical protein